MMNEILLFSIVMIFLIIACIVDMKTFNVPNFLTVGAMVVGIALNLILYGHIIDSLFGILMGIMLVYFGNFIDPHKLGGGDAKIFAMIGSFTNPYVVLCTYIGAWLICRIYRALHRLINPLPYVPFILIVYSVFYIMEIYGRA